MYTLAFQDLLNLRARCRCWMFWKAFLLDPAAFLCVPLKLWSFVPRKTIDVWRRTDKLFCSDFRVALASKKVSHISGWWFGNLNLMTFHILGIFIIPTDELIFFRGVGQPPTSISYISTRKHVIQNHSDDRQPRCSKDILCYCNYNACDYCMLWTYWVYSIYIL